MRVSLGGVARKKLTNFTIESLVGSGTGNQTADDVINPDEGGEFRNRQETYSRHRSLYSSSPSTEEGRWRKGGEGGGLLVAAAATASAVERSDYSTDRILSSRVSGGARSASGYATERSSQHVNVHSTIRLSQSSGCANTSLPVRLVNCPTVAPSVPLEWSPRDIFLDSLNSLDSNNCWLQGSTHQSQHFSCDVCEQKAHYSLSKVGDSKQPWSPLPLQIHPGLDRVDGLISPSGLNYLQEFQCLMSRYTRTHPYLCTTNDARDMFGYNAIHAGGYRRAKRLRTAFSPSQMMQLEEAFGKKQYVVGEGRRELAFRLGLTETQVKVWFQNRRTKQKRITCELENEADDKESVHNE